MKTFYVAYWDSEDRDFSHWKFGTAKARTPLEVLNRVLPYARTEEVYYESPQRLVYEYEDGTAFVSTDKDWVLGQVSTSIGKHDLERELD